MRVMVSHSNKIIVILISIFICLSLLLVFNASADNTIEDNIDAIFNIEFISGTELNVSIISNVEKITLNATGTSYSKNEIISIYENNSEIMGAIKYVLKNSILNQIKNIFDEAYIYSLNELPSFDNGIFYDKYQINLSSNFFNIENDIKVSDLINGILNMGAIVNYSFNLIAEQGWSNSYNFILSNSLGYQRTNGIVDNNIINWNVENKNQNIYSKIAEISIKDTQANLKFNEEDIEFDFEIDINNKTNLNLSILTKTIYVPDIIKIPDSITNIKYIPSDGIRLFIENYFLTWDDFFNEKIKFLIDYIKPKIESYPFNQTLNFSFNWDLNSTINCTTPYNIKNMDNQPPIIAHFSDDSINLEICGISTKAFFGLINSGAKSNLSSLDLNFGNNFENINYPYMINLNLPDDITIKNQNIISWNNSDAYFGNITSNISENYNEEIINTSIDISVITTDLNLLSFFTGKTQLSLGLSAKEIQNRNVTTLPYYFSLPKKINLQYYNSDLIRLCINEKIFDNTNIDKFLSSENKSFEYILKNMFKESDIKAFLDYQIFDESLKWDGDIKNMDDNSPIKISSYSNIAYSVPFRFTFLLPSLKISEQTINLTGIKNQNVNYKIIFPKGLEIKLINASDNQKINISEDGNYYIEVSFNKDESNLTEIVTFQINPSLVFIIGLFVPCIISLLITLLLVIIIYLIKRKRRIRKKSIIEDSNEYYNDKNQNYYMPPPPSKK